MSNNSDEPHQSLPQQEIGAATEIRTAPKKKREMPAALRKLHGRAHWLAPNWIPSYQSDLDYFRRVDKESNDESRVPEDVDLRVRAVWGVEVYGPNESDGLYEALRRLGWSAGSGGRERGGALAWVEQQRSYGWGGSYNVGAVVKPGRQRKLLMVDNQVGLPEGVDHLLVRIHQICPAVTCMVVCFVLDESAAKRYEQELNLDRRTRLKRGARWWVTHLNPSHIKQESISARRSEMRALVRDWFRRNAPGYFAASGPEDCIPFAEILSVANDDVFSGEASKIYFDWRRILVNPPKHEVWTRQSTTPLRFVLDRARRPDDERNLLVASLSLSSVPEDQLKMYGGPNGYVHICNAELEGVLPYVAASAYLVENLRELKRAREQLRLSKSRRRTLRSIKRIQQFFDRTAGLPAVAREIFKFSQHPGALNYYCGKFTAANLGRETTERDFSEELRQRLHNAAATLLEDESSTREHFSQLSSVLSIRESIGAQRRMEFLTFAALLVAGLSFAAQWPAGWDKSIKSGYETTQSYVLKLLSVDQAHREDMK